MVRFFGVEVGSYYVFSVVLVFSSLDDASGDCFF